MKRIVLLVLVLVLCGGAITATVMIANARRSSESYTTKLDTSKSTNTVDVIDWADLVPDTTSAQQEEPAAPAVYGQDIFPTGTLVFTQDNIGKAFSSNGQGDYRLILYSNQFEQNKSYGFCWTINPHAYDIENVSVLRDNDKPAIFYYIGDWNAAVANGTNYMQVLSSNELQDVLTNHWTFETGAGETQILFCPFLHSNQAEQPSEEFCSSILQYVTISVFELS